MDEAITFRVEGMGCQGCVSAVEKAVRALVPAAKIDVDLATGAVKILGAGQALNAPDMRGALAAAITKAGYDIVG